eukprot:TRINITY_DN7239_c0_g1_i1.p1 TRINITY_DN7239_c0_g1~~TRINITY_DN7239_c0_g1_i1.p1  ORF type:complete len:467 (+),score=78.39 TRINITY_DN7239_c0_g1_i1:52-1401(+)
MTDCGCAHPATSSPESCIPSCPYPVPSGADDKRALEDFIKYLQISTVHPKPDYTSAAVFLAELATRIPNLLCETWDLVEGKPIVLMTLPGRDPTLPTVLLSSHTDVVPVDPEHWHCDPWAASQDGDGNIFARGTQDMKCVGSQYLESLRRLLADSDAASTPMFLRTIHLTYLPDEEIGGVDGMKVFLEHPRFKELNVGIVLDEGLASETDTTTVFYGERSPWWLKIKATGPTGHGSRFIESPAFQKLHTVVGRMLEFRAAEEKRYKNETGEKKCGRVSLGDVTTLNISYMKGGMTKDGGNTFSMNVVPMDAEAGFDIRVAPTVDLVEFEKQIDRWTTDGLDGVKWEFIMRSDCKELTALDESNPWWKSFKGACDAVDVSLDHQIFPANTDSRYIRKLGIPAIGFSPITHTLIRLHDHNEYLNERVFLQGIRVYNSVIPALANNAPESSA